MNIVVLEHPRISSVNRFNDIANTPLWSCLMGGYAAASLTAAGFDTQFIDAATPGSTFDGLWNRFRKIKMDLLCINAVYFWEHTPRLFEFIEQVKTENEGIHINLFGFFPSLVYKDILTQCPGVDSIAVGEFEHTLTELAAGIDLGTSLDSIQGVALKNGLESQGNKARKPSKDLDGFVFPLRSAQEGSATILASRGCYNHCSFCPVPSFYNQGPLWRGRSPGNIALEMAQLADQGARDFYFVDPNFIGPGKAGKKRLLDLMALIRPLNIRFGMETRPGDLDEQILESLIASGFNSLLMGVESGSSRLLGSMNKSIGTKTAQSAIALCRQYGIEPAIGFLMFVPDSSLSDLRANMDFLMENSLLDRLARTANLLCHCQIVLAGTSGYQSFKKQNRLTTCGVFGFEGTVRFSDPRVEWMADLVVFTCHQVLRSMSCDTSPIFWKNRPDSVFSKTNEFLVTTFFSLLGQVEKHGVMDNAMEMKDKITQQMTMILSEKPQPKTDWEASPSGSCSQDHLVST